MQIKIHPNLNEITIDTLKKLKLDELNNSCNAAILSNFSAIVDGVTYYFSHDSEAQINFSTAKLAFMDGTVTSAIPWTVYDSNGNVMRLNLNKDKFDLVYAAHLQHIMDNISKFRDVLQPNIMAATTEEQLNSILW